MWYTVYFDHFFAMFHSDLSLGILYPRSLFFCQGDLWLYSSNHITAISVALHSLLEQGITVMFMLWNVCFTWKYWVIHSIRDSRKDHFRMLLRQKSALWLFRFKNIHTYSLVTEICMLFRGLFVYAHSQWETTLLCNVVYHWFGALSKWSTLFK